MAELTHINSRGEAEMVDVSTKQVTSRVARATGEVVMAEATMQAIQSGGIGKGDVFAVARVAGIQAAKRTSELIPLCHPLPLSKVTVEFQVLSPTRLGVTAECKVASQTGVEMEALTATSVAALTIYDMCKAIDRGMTIEAVRLEHKSGGKSGTWERT